MLIDDELKDLLVNGEFTDRIQLAVEVGLVTKDDEQHLVAFVGGTPIFHSTYPANADHLVVRAAISYMKKNLWNAVFGLVRDLGYEAVQLPEYENRKKIARLWAEDVGSRAKAKALRRQQDEIKRLEREAATFEPVIKDHQWRADLLRRSLAAIAELRLKKKPVSQKTIAPIVYGRQDLHSKESAQAQYWRELKEGFGRPASKTFARLVAINKTWEELTSDEKSDLNCPEAERVNRRRRKLPEKKAVSVY
ncbi:MAG TPA: hypothetical protein VE732_09765 [Nitrososphaera sp.]|jgi:hypothetical protein|nr:hypothetical protein [Nitrososphaera sp.]